MKANAKRIFCYAGMVIMCFLLQSTIFQSLSMGNIKPNICIILVSSIGFMRGKKEGLFIGFASGLLMDIFFGTLLGFYAFVYMVIGYANGLFRRLFFDDDIKLPLALIALSEFLFGIGMYVAQYLLRSRFQFPYYLMHIIIPELVYTILITLLFYPIILVINRKLEAQEQRSGSKFV